MARFYALSISPTLLGEVQLIRRWGRIGARGQTMCHSFEHENDAVRMFLDLLRRKRRRGYAPKIATPPALGQSRAAPALNFSKYT